MKQQLDLLYKPKETSLRSEERTMWLALAEDLRYFEALSCLGVQQPPVTPTPEDLKPSSGLFDHLNQCVHASMKTYTHTTK